jgi:hypothetical protein
MQMKNALYALLCLTAPCFAQAPEDPAARNLALLKQYYEFGKTRDHESQARMWAPAASNLGHQTDMVATRLALEDIHRTFPDYRTEPLETRAVGDTVVQMSRISGTHRGEARTAIFGGLLRGAAPTGKRFEVLVTHWWRFNESGKITWHQVTRDDLGMYLQLGLVIGKTATTP